MDEMQKRDDAEANVVIPENELPPSERPRDDAWQSAASERRRETRYERAHDRRVERRVRRSGYRSLFWPMVLIGAGVLWMLSNFGVVTSENWAVLVQLWPILLIAAGLDLLFGRFSAILGSLIGLLTVAVVVGLVLVGPSMGWARETSFFGAPIIIGGDAEVKSVTFSEPLNGVEQANIDLGLSFEPTTVTALPAGSNELLHADIDYIGELTYDAEGSGTSRDISLRQNFAQVGFNPGFNSRDMQWDIALSREVPLDLNVDASSGAATLDLSELMISDLVVEASSGAMRLSLPSGQYDADLTASSGLLNVSLADGADVNMMLDGSSGGLNFSVGDNAALDLEASLSSGRFTLDLGVGTGGTYRLEGGSGGMQVTVPRGAAVRVEVVDRGSGGINLPSDFQQVEQGGDDGEGVWQTDGYDTASTQINIIVDTSSGGFTVSY